MGNDYIAKKYADSIFRGLNETSKSSMILKFKFLSGLISVMLLYSYLIKKNYIYGETWDCSIIVCRTVQGHHLSFTCHLFYGKKYLYS